MIAASSRILTRRSSNCSSTNSHKLFPSSAGSSEDTKMTNNKNSYQLQNQDQPHFLQLSRIIHEASARRTDNQIFVWASPSHWPTHYRICSVQPARHILGQRNLRLQSPRKKCFIPREGTWVKHFATSDCDILWRIHNARHMTKGTLTRWQLWGGNVRI